jgi:hypothetical protein
MRALGITVPSLFMIFILVFGVAVTAQADSYLGELCWDVADGHMGKFRFAVHVKGETCTLQGKLENGHIPGLGQEFALNGTARYSKETETYIISVNGLVEDGNKVTSASFDFFLDANLNGKCNAVVSESQWEKGTGWISESGTFQTIAGVIVTYTGLCSMQ